MTARKPWTCCSYPADPLGPSGHPYPLRETPVDARVVTDRNRISGGGVTAGIDFGLVRRAKLPGADIAEVTQLAVEYDPAPPFDAGTPKEAGPVVMKKMQEWLGPAFDSVTPMCISAGKKVGDYTPVAR
jgi:cyclohexyl-isocyanide hydratase